MYKVIFDTNSIRNAESTKEFLGGRSDLEKFSKVAEIIIPDIVVEEIKKQKRVYLERNRSSFLSNPFYFLRNLDVKDTTEINLEEVISDLEARESVSYEVITLTKSDALERLKRMALSNDAPFEMKSDKGFKDAYAFLTILEYIEGSPTESFFFVTKDERFKGAFKDIDQVRIVNSFEDFEKYIDDYFHQEYFINRLKETVNPEISAESIKDSWMNLDGNWILKIECQENTYRVVVDFSAREVIEFTDFDFSIFIQELINSRSFSVTHSMISSLSGYTQYLSDDEIRDLIEAATVNDQIFWVAGDDDVKEFFLKIFQAKSNVVSDSDIQKRFMDIFDY